jgi:hypothetical protein
VDLSTLPCHARAHAPGWAHPYATGPFSPFFYADGDEDDGQDDDAGSGDDDQDEDEGDQDDDAGGTDDDGDPEGADQLGDPGKRALDSMKGKLRAEREKRKALEKQLSEKDDADDSEKLRREVETAALSKANGRIVRAEVKAAAAGKLADPADAYRFLDLEQFEVDDDGNVDSEEIAEAIQDLIKSKPYLAAATAKRFQGTGDGGAARKAPRPKQLSRADLKTMTPAQIVKAKADGRLNNLLGDAG